MIPTNEVFDRIRQVHSELEHAGYKRTHKCIHERYYGISQEEVAWLLGKCQTCLLNRGNKSKGPLEPIITNSILERFQIDLVDMRLQADGQFKWILHIVDHFSKYTELFALQSKRAVEVAESMALFLGLFEPPKYLHCDNGKEFKGVLLVLAESFGIRVINGRPRNPSTQGLVEQANGTMKTRIRSWMHDNKSMKWASSLPKISMAINRSVHGTTGKTPYEVMFGRKPRWEDSSVVAGINIVIEDEQSTMEMIEQSASTDEFTRIEEFMEYYQFDFDSIPSIPLSQSEVPTLDNVLESTPLESPPPIPPCIQASSQPMVLGNPPPLPPRPQIAQQVKNRLIDLPVNSNISNQSNDSQTSSPLSSPPSSPEANSSFFQTELGEIPSQLDTQIRKDISLDPALLTQHEREIQLRNVHERAKMQRKPAKQHTIEVFLPGDLVSLKIPREDRAATNNLRVFCRVVKQSRLNRYQLLTRHGLLTNHYPVNTLLRIPPAAQDGLDKIIPPLPAGSDGIGGAGSSNPAVRALFQKKITLHAVAALESHSESVGISCNCKGICTGRCRCKKNRRECSVHCHADEHDCGNLCPLERRTEMAIISRQAIQPDAPGDSSEEDPPLAEDLDHNEQGSFGLGTQRIVRLSRRGTTLEGQGGGSGSRGNRSMNLKRKQLTSDTNSSVSRVTRQRRN